MKYGWLLLVFSLIGISVNCQLDKSTWITGGAGSLYSYRDVNSSTAQPTVTGKLTEINLSEVVATLK